MNGKRLGAKADRNGFFYVNDAKTGKLVNAFPFVKKITWATGIDLATGRPKFVAESRPGDPGEGNEKQGKRVFNAPSFLGGKNQMPMAYSPDTKLFYVPANEWGMEIWNEPISETTRTRARIGRSNGSVMRRNMPSSVAPSMAALS